MTARKTLRRALAFVVTAVVVYFALGLLSVVVMIAEGGGVSCYEVCSPTQRWLDETAPWPQVTAVVLSALAGLVAAWPFRR